MNAATTTVPLATMLGAALLGVLVGVGGGLVVGHGARRAIPALLGLRDRALPFGGPWLELATAAFFAVTAWRLGLRAGPWPYLMTALLVTIAACDYHVKLIPDRLSLPTAALGLAAGVFDPRLLFEIPLQRLLLRANAPALADGAFEGPTLAVAGAVLGFLALETIRRLFGLLAGLEVMGFGDSKLAFALGAFLGPVGLLMTLPLAFIVGVVHGLVYLRLSGQPHSPFGPPLALAGWVTLLFHQRLGGAVTAFQHLILALPLPLLAGLYTVLLAVAGWLIWRTRQKAADYEALIEEDYRRVEEQLED